MKKFTDIIVRSSFEEVGRNKNRLKSFCHNIDEYSPENAYAKGVEEGIQLVFETMNDKRLEQD